MKKHGGSAVQSIVFMEEMRKIVTGGDDKKIVVFDFPSWKEEKSLEGHNNSILKIVKIDPQKIVSGSFDMTLKLWSIESGLCLHTFEGHTSNFFFIHFS